ncbi:MAG: hypothetical protein ACN6OM_09765 [Alcaligenes nematophilus]|uniref:hypothetical protein n=1 Tax=Alcaligenes nematophilus TaxID=2994643 RepID=UPI003D03A51D
MQSTKMIGSENGCSLVGLLYKPDKKVIGYAVVDSDGNIVAGPFGDLPDTEETFDDLKNGHTPRGNMLKF